MLFVAPASLRVWLHESRFSIIVCLLTAGFRSALNHLIFLPLVPPLINQAVQSPAALPAALATALTLGPLPPSMVPIPTSL